MVLYIYIYIYIYICYEDFIFTLDLLDKYLMNIKNKYIFIKINYICVK
jgi:hypothetical protein